MPAERLPMIMGRFSEALGVSCDHCHVVKEWSKEDKEEKQIAREMMAMARTINADLLAKIPNLKSEHPTVTCTTCHRGAVKPATTMQQ
jgi:alkyl hydroperoxide reductase subunit AhpC